MDESDFSYIQKLVFDKSANVIESGKEYLAEIRLLPIFRSEGCESIHELVSKMRMNQSEDLKDKVVEAMTTNETLFFRDAQPYEALKRVVIPSLMEKNKTYRTINIWSAACSTGQEPYSIAMLICENFPSLLDWNVKIIASDIAKKVIERAHEGIYSQLEVNRGLPPELLAKHFKKVGSDWQISEKIKNMVEYKEINLAKTWPPSLPLLDIIFMRNVMIYFDIPTKKNIFKKLAHLIKSESYLFLGGAETTMNLSESFERITADKTSFYQLKRNS